MASIAHTKTDRIGAISDRENLFSGLLQKSGWSIGWTELSLAYGIIPGAGQSLTRYSGFFACIGCNDLFGQRDGWNQTHSFRAVDKVCFHVKIKESEETVEKSKAGGGGLYISWTIRNYLTFQRRFLSCNISNFLNPFLWLSSLAPFGVVILRMGGVGPLLRFFKYLISSCAS